MGQLQVIVTLHSFATAENKKTDDAVSKYAACKYIDRAN